MAKTNGHNEHQELVDGWAKAQAKVEKAQKELDAARAIRRFHDKNLRTKRVDGIVLYYTDEVKKYSKKRLRNGQVSRLVFTGIEVERLEKICEVYYQTQYDIGQKQLLTLAKRVAKL